MIQRRPWVYGGWSPLAALAACLTTPCCLGFPALVYTGAGIYFMVALALGYWFLFGKSHPKRDADAACTACMPVEAERRVQERSLMPEDLPATRRQHVCQPKGAMTW
jgi:hypothetical protein